MEIVVQKGHGFPTFDYQSATSLSPRTCHVRHGRQVSLPLCFGHHGIALCPTSLGLLASEVYCGGDLSNLHL